MSIDILVISVASNLLILFIYFYLYCQYRQPYLKKWLAAWSINILRASIEKNYYMDIAPSVSVSVIIVAINIMVSFLIIAGTAEFAGKMLSKRWSISAVICLIFSIILILLDTPLQIRFIPLVIYVGVAYIATGLIIWDLEAGRVAKKITATTFLLLGLHFFDVPFLLAIPWIAPWGFFLDNVLKVFAALNIVFIYLEKERKEIEDAKNEVEKYHCLLEKIAANTTDVIYLYNMASHTFEYISPVVKQLTGFEAGYYMKLNQIFRIIHPRDRDIFKKFVRGSYDKKLITLRIRHSHRDTIWVEQKHSYIKDETGKAIAIEGIVRNVTKRILLEQELARYDRLDIAGEMAASFADEIRQPLTLIKGYLQLMAANRLQFEKYNDRLPIIMAELDRTNDIITNLLTLCKNKRIEAKNLNLNNIRKSVYPLWELSSSHANLEIRLMLNEISNLMLDEQEVRKAIIHLVHNSVESMPLGGIVDIITEQKGRQVILAIRDKGKGIPQDIMENIGKPFTSTKSMGNGLGLAFCFRIAQRHNAKVDIETGPEGTTVTFRFKAG